ncbi:helix-turn-helix transcriptional regulator [Salinactinospora qingdaonensis]
MTSSVRLRGRDAEQRALAVALGDARSGDSASLLVSGGPGVGKTALLDHACATASDFTVLRAAGVPSESDLDFAGLLRLLRPVMDRVNELPQPQSDVLWQALRTGRVVESDRFTLSVALLDLLCLLGRTKPLLCCIDDAQWLDARSLDAFAFAARRLAEDSVAIAFAARDNDAKPVVPGVSRLAIGPLSDNAMRTVITDRAVCTVHPTVEEQVTRAAHGNPLAARGFVDTLTAEQLAGRCPLPEPLVLDETLLEAHTPAIRALPETTREVLLLAAADPEAGVDTLIRAAGDPQVSISAFTPAEDEGLVRIEGDQVRFHDPLLREALYQNAPLIRRREAHALLAAALDAEREPSRHARHRAAAAAGPNAKLAVELAGAAMAARKVEGHIRASVAFERAAELTPDPRMRSCRLSYAAHDAWLSGEPQRAAALLDRAQPFATGGRLPGVVELLRGHMELLTGNTIDAAESLLAAKGQLLPHDRELAIRALLRAADAASLAGDPMRHATAASELAKLGRRDDPPELQLGVTFLEGCEASFRGDYAGSVGPLRRVLELAEHVNEPAELVWASIAGLRLGDLRQVHTLANRAISAARRRGALSVVPQAMEFLVYSQLWTRRFPSAANNCLTGLRLARETGQPNCATHHLAALTLVSAIQGDAETCRARARSVAEQASENSLGLPAAMSTWALAVLDLASGDAARAFSRLRVLAHAGPGQGHPTMRLLTAPYFVEAAARTGEIAQAQRVLAGYRHWATATGSTWGLALHARCQGLLSKPEEAPEHFEEALRLHQANGNDALEHARTELLYGSMLRRSRLPGQAREHLREAQDTFHRFGTRLWLKQARAELRALGDLERSEESGAADELTVQQREIARLVAEGATNREIAAHMFISPRTVEYHLRGIFRKLNIRSRVDLTRFFR